MTDSERSVRADRIRVKNWLHERLQNERANEEWSRLLNAAWTDLIQKPWVELLPQEALESAIESLKKPELAAAFAECIVNPLLHEAFLELRDDNSKLSEWLSPEAIKVLEDLVSAPKFIRAEWIEAFFKEKAVEEVLSDSLYRALRDFSTIIPRLVLRNLPSGRFRALGMAGNLTEKLAAQLEKVIEPEIRSFLASGSQKAIRRACDFTIEQADSETSIQMRRNLIRFAAERSLSFHFSVLNKRDFEALLVENVNYLHKIHENPRLNNFISQGISKLYQSNQSSSVADLLGAFTLELGQYIDVFSDLSWPILKNTLDSEEIQTWLDGLVDELLDQYEGSNPRNIDAN